jgi:hypothetical protein
VKSLSVNVLGSSTLVEQCPRITIEETLTKITPQIKEQLLKTQLNMQGFNVDLAVTETAFGGERFWFKCPLCNKRAGVLFQHPISNLIGCRACLGLEYKSRRYKGMLEARI